MAIKIAISTIQPDIRPDTGYPANSVSGATLLTDGSNAVGRVSTFKGIFAKKHIYILQFFNLTML